MDVPFVGRTRAVSGTKTKGRRRGTPRPSAEVLEARLVLSQVFTVTNTSDNTSMGSLRWAIGQVNSDGTDTPASPDQIQFDIPTTDPGYKAGIGVWTIAPTTPLPIINAPCVIDGYTQPGAVANTSATADNAVIKIDLDGGDEPISPATIFGLSFGAGSGGTGGLTSGVRGLQISNFADGQIFLDGTENFVEGCSVGPNSGSPEFDPGIVISPGSNDDAIGGTAPAARNLISGNYIGILSGNNGMGATGPTDDLLIAGNLIDANSYDISVQGGSGDTIGGTTPGARNVISGSANSGIELGTAAVTDCLIEGNYIGTDATGTNPDPNEFDGINVFAGSNDTIGGTAPGAGNLISGNAGNGVAISGTTALVQGNLIGTNADGTAALGNGGFGISLSSSDNTIGGTAAGARNVIGRAGSVDVWIDGQGTSRNLVEGNYIGTDLAGVHALGAQVLVLIGGGATQNTIGGTTAGARNVISGATAGSGPGVDIQGEGTSENVVEGNFIGPGANGIAHVGNSRGGVEIGLGATGNVIGGTAPGAGNVISYNGAVFNFGFSFGVDIDGQGTSGNAVEGNLIGTDPSGTRDEGNLGDGVELTNGASGNTIGGSSPGAGNVIAHSGVPPVIPGPPGLAGVGVAIFDTRGGVAILPGTGTDDPILNNTIYGNEVLGINLVGGMENSFGVTANSPGGPHAGANDLQNYPVLAGAGSTTRETAVLGTLNSTPNATFTVQFFANPTADPSGYGQGQTYLGQLTGVKTDASGNASFTFFAPVGVAGQFVSATATDPNGNTSEFAKDVQATYVPSADVAVSVLNSTATTTVGGPVAFTFQIKNLGPDTASGVAVVDTLPANLGSATIVASEGQSTLVDGTFTDRVASLPVGESFTVTVTGTATAVGTIDNELVAAAAEPDPDPSNNTAGVAIPVTPVPPSPAATTTTLVAMPNPAVAGQPVTFTATVAPASPQDGPTGVVTFFIDGIGHAAPVVPSAGGLIGTATYTTTFLTAGAHGVVALYGGDASFAPSVSTSTFETVNPGPPAGPAPRVVEVLRYGYHALPTQLVVEFNEPLDAMSAQDPGNYAIAGPRGRPIAVVSASLMPGGTAVLLRPRARLDVHEVYTLTVAGVVKSAAGVPMGSEQVKLVSSRNFVWRPSPPGGSLAGPSAHAVDALLAAEYRAHLRAIAALRHRR